MLDRLLIDLVPRILNGPTGRRWFGDGAPTWSQGRAGKPAKTSGEADRRTPPARQGPAPPRQGQQSGAAPGGEDRGVPTGATLPERRVPRVHARNSAILRGDGRGFARPLEM